MKKIFLKSKIKNWIDNVLLFNLFLVIIFAFFFIFAVIMQLNGVYIFLSFFNNIWNPLIIPLISILILGSLVNGIISWLQQKVLSQEEDI